VHCYVHTKFKLNVKFQKYKCKTPGDPIIVDIKKRICQSRLKYAKQQQSNSHKVYLLRLSSPMCVWNPMKESFVHYSFPKHSKQLRVWGRGQKTLQANNKNTWFHCVLFLKMKQVIQTMLRERKRRPLEMAQIYQLSLIRTAAYSGM
jgi:hypothetical protein